MSHLKKIPLSKRGFMSTEAAILVPMMLVGLCIVLAFMFVFFKWGASQLIFNHMDISARLSVTPRYHFEMLRDSRTSVEYNAKESQYLGEIKERAQEVKVVMNLPYLQESQQLFFRNSHFSLSYQREIQMAHWLRHTLN